VTDTSDRKNRSAGYPIRPSSVRIDTCSLCQLRCPLCQAIGHETSIIGRGALQFDYFRELVHRNPWIKKVELGNFGEVFLNKDLPRILLFAHEKGIVTEIDEGANLNNASDEALEALVLGRTNRLRCAIDGVTQAVYEKYRIGGSLKKVIRNIEKINALKERCKSPFPRLVLQCIIFPHNAHQVDRVSLLARMLNMEVDYKLDCLSRGIQSGDSGIARGITGYADRDEYLNHEKRHYMRHLCHDLWHSPQINWDGKLLGCSRNIWLAFADNVFEGDLLDHFNNEKMVYARAMLLGHRPPRNDLPCIHCGVFASMLQYDNWISEHELSGLRKEKLPIRRTVYAEKTLIIPA